MSTVMNNVIKFTFIGGASVGIFELGGLFGRGYILGFMKKYNSTPDSLLQDLSIYNGKGKWKAALVSSFAELITNQKKVTKCI